MRRIKFILLSILIISTIFSCKSLPSGLGVKTPVYNADNVDFYYDLTYKKDGETHY